MSKFKHPTVAKRLSDIKKLDKSDKVVTHIKDLLTDFPDFIPGWLELGLILRQENNRIEALNTFQKAVELSPKSLWANINLAIELRCSGRVQEAEERLKKVLEYHPNNFDVLMHLGYLEQHKHEKKQALDFFVLASQNAINSASAIKAELNITNTLGELGKIDEAVIKVKSILQKSPDNIKAKLAYAHLLQKTGDFDTAIAIYQEIIALKPQNIKALLKIGDLFRCKNDFNQALKYHQKALEIAPHNPEVNTSVAMDFQILGDLAAAEKQLQKVSEHYPDDYSRLMALAQLELTRQNLELALKYFQKIIDNYPYKIEPHISIIKILSRLNRFDEAAQNLKLLRQKYPKKYCILLCAGKFERKLGQREKALQLFNLAQATATNITQYLEVQILAIEELRDLGRFDEAMKLIDLIIKQFPENIRPKMLKGSILQKQVNLIAAADQYKSILAIEPNHLYSRSELARIYSQLGQIETAISLLEETYKSSGGNIQVLIQLGSLNQALKEWEKAHQWYQKACQEYPYNPQGYCKVAHLMFLQGKTDAAIKLLQKAQVKISNSQPLILKLIELQILLGNLELSHKLLQQELQKYPQNISLLLLLCRVQMHQGNYIAALGVLEQISTDQQDCISQIEQLKANIYFHLYKYPQAERHLEKTLALKAESKTARSRLAAILLLTGRLDEAYQELKVATEKLQLKTSPGKSSVPLKSNTAVAINELRINPPLLSQLQIAQQETGIERILSLGSLLAQEPSYLGASLYLARELRIQGIFDELQNTILKYPNHISAIPKRIIQFWDDPEPPQEIQRICQSWRDFNPEYEYIRFSLETAIAFLKEHYDQKVLSAFKNCDQPATQSDFFRLAYLNKMGGFYADADDLCRKSLNSIVGLNPELVVLQEDISCFGNNFLGCIPGQSMIRAAFYKAVNSLGRYCNESPWLKTGPALITSVVCSGLIPYLSYPDYQVWPRLLVLSQTQLRKFIFQHMCLPYKRTDKSWHQNTYLRRIKVIAPN